MRRNPSSLLPQVLLAFSALVLLALSTSTTFGQPPAPQPTPEHEGLLHEVGSWNATLKLWPAPDAKPITGTATETNRMVGKMWVVSDFEAELMGFPFSGHGQFGYDPIKKKYVGTWIDSNGPLLGLMEGTMDKATNTLTMFTNDTDATTKKTTLVKLVTTYTDHDHKVFTIYKSVEGEKDKWWKHMEITYTRATKESPNRAPEKELVK